MGRGIRKAPSFAYKAEVTSLGKVTFWGSPSEEGLRQEAGEQCHTAEASEGRERRGAGRGGACGPYNWRAKWTGLRRKRQHSLIRAGDLPWVRVE